MGKTGRRKRDAGDRDDEVADAAHRVDVRAGVLEDDRHLRAEAPQLKPFVRGSWQQLLNAHAGRPMLVAVIPASRASAEAPARPA